MLSGNLTFYTSDSQATPAIARLEAARSVELIGSEDQTSGASKKTQNYS